MELTDLLQQLTNLGVSLRVEGDSLKVAAPPGAITPDLAAGIKLHKAALLGMLAEAGPNKAPGPAVPRSEDRETYPLTPSQERNLFAAQNGPGLPTAYRIRGPLQPEKLKETLDQIVGRQASLRTVIEPFGDGYRARITPPGPAQWTYTDLSANPDENAWRGPMTQAATTPIDLEKGPLYRFLLFRLHEDDHILVCVYSQLIFDGASFDVILKELTEGYAALARGTPWPLPALEAEYVDFAAWKRNTLRDQGAAMLAWWRGLLGTEVPASPVPLDHPRPKVPDYRGSAVPLVIPADFAAEIRGLAKAQGVTPQMVLLGALFVLFGRLTGRNDPLIATPVEGRSSPAFEPLIGTFVNMVLLKAELRDDESFAAFLPRLRDLGMAAYDHQHLPLEHLGLKLSRGPAMAQAPLFQVEFSYQQVSERSTMMGPLALSQIELHGGGSSNELTFWVKDWGHLINGAVEYSTKLYDRTTIVHWLECFYETLRAVVARPHQSLGEIDVVGRQASGVEQTLRSALGELPGRKGLPAGVDPLTLSYRDAAGRPLPLGAWGTLTGPQGTVAGPLRLRSDGGWDVPPAAAEKETRPPGRLVVLDPVESRLIELYAEALDAKEVSLQDSFFDLGGHSLLGVSLLGRIRAAFDVKLALAVLFEAPTPYALARVIRREKKIPDPETGLTDAGKAVWTTVVPIQPAGTRVPIFVAAGFGGNPMNLRHLAKALGPDQPFYGLQHRGTDGLQKPHRDYLSMAREYADDIRRVQPRGPYVLGGFSSGGTPAFEAARILKAAGEEVAAVIMFDAVSKVGYESPESPPAGAGTDGALPEGPGPKPPLVDRLLRKSREVGDRVWQETGALLALAAPYRFRHEALASAGSMAYRRYVPTPQEVDVVVLRAKIRDLNVWDPTNGWAAVTRGRLEIVAVPGGHTSHVEEDHAAETARLLTEALGKYLPRRDPAGSPGPSRR